MPGHDRKTTLRLIPYLRASSDTQVEGYGLEVQEKVIRAWAKGGGHRLAPPITDAGVSGALHAVDRPGLSAALAALKSGEADGLVVARLDRLARAVTVQEAALAVIWRSHGKVFTADHGEVLPDDPDDPLRGAMRQMVGVFAELDRKMVVKRLRDGRAAKAAAGRKVTGAYAFGYAGQGRGRDRDAVPHEGEQAAVRRILDLRAEGASYRDIVAALHAEGLRPRRAERWSPMTVRSVVLRAAPGGRMFATSP